MYNKYIFPAHKIMRSHKTVTWLVVSSFGYGSDFMLYIRMYTITLRETYEIQKSVYSRYMYVCVCIYTSTGPGRGKVYKVKIMFVFLSSHAA